MKRDLKCPPIGLSREEAADHVGLGMPLFDRLVAEGRMPRPRQVGSRLIWHRLEVEDAFTDLPFQGATTAHPTEEENSFAAIRRQRDEQAKQERKAGRK